MSRPRPTDLSDRLRGAVGPVVTDAGLHLEDLVVASAGRRKVVRVTVDLPDGPGGVDSDRLGDVSRAVSAVLDDADLVEGAYTLEVSTPGADRPLSEPRHFRRAAGRLVRLRTRQGGEITGRLREARQDAVTLEVLGPKKGTTGHTELAYAEIAEARVEIELKRDAGPGQQNPEEA